MRFSRRVLIINLNLAQCKAILKKKGIPLTPKGCHPSETGASVGVYGVAILSACGLLVPKIVGRNLFAQFAQNVRTGRTDHPPIGERYRLGFNLIAA